jgi:hypothetical protein
LGELSGEVAGASKEYARAALGNDFLSLTSVNQGGTPSIARTALGKMLGLPIGVNSPLAVGAAVSAGAGVLKGVNAAASSPALRRGFSSILADHKMREAQESAPDEEQPLRRNPNEFESVDEASAFIQGSKPGTKFKIGGKTYKVIENPGRKKEDLQKLPKFLQEAYHRSKANAKGRNTFTLA